MRVTGEGFQFDFPDAIEAILFDQQDRNLPNYHDLEEFPRVDFIVELPEDILFIEVKDPSSPLAQSANIEKFVDGIKNDSVIWSLGDKYQYSFYFRWAENKLDKNIHYIILFTLDLVMTETVTERLKRYLAPLWDAKSTRWCRQPIKTCRALNLDSWNSVFPKWHVERV